MIDFFYFQLQIHQFRSDRGWEKYHSHQNMLLAFFVEISELIELFLYQNEEEYKNIYFNDRESVADELVDVFWWHLLLFYDLDLTIEVNSLNSSEEVSPQTSLFNLVKKSGYLIESMNEKYNKETIEEILNSSLKDILRLFDFFECDITREFERKMKKNEKKYPITL